MTAEMKNFEKSIIKAMRVCAKSTYHQIYLHDYQVDGWDGHEDESKQKWTFLGL